LDGWTPPQCAGLFGIFVADPNWAPKPYQPLYFGEFGNNVPASRMLGECRILIAASRGKTLLVSVLPLPFSTTSQRCAIQSELISAYNPLCQADIFVPLPEEPRRRRIGFLPQFEPASESASSR